MAETSDRPKFLSAVIVALSLAVSLLLGLVFAQEYNAVSAQVVIKAPAQAKVGQLVVLNVADSDAASFTWKVEPSTNNFLVIENGKQAVFSSEVGGDYLFIVGGGGHDGSVDVKTHLIHVIGPDGPVGPDVNTFAAKVAQWCEPVESPTKRDDALKLSQSFLSVSAIISSGVVTTPADMVEATKKSNQDALGDKVDNWVPFLQQLQAELKAQAEAGKLPDPAAHAAAWKAIGEALRQYAETLK